MADHEETAIRNLAIMLSRLYTMLVDTCGALPVPIALPTEGMISAQSEAAPAIQRVVTLAQEMPVLPEEESSALQVGALLTLAAFDLYGVLVNNEFVQTRAEGALLTISTAEDALRDVIRWIVANRD